MPVIPKKPEGIQARNAAQSNSLRTARVKLAVKFFSNFSPALLTLGVSHGGVVASHNVSRNPEGAGKGAGKGVRLLQSPKAS